MGEERKVRAPFFVLLCHRLPWSRLRWREKMTVPFLFLLTFRIADPEAGPATANRPGKRSTDPVRRQEQRRFAVRSGAESRFSDCASMVSPVSFI